MMQSVAGCNVLVTGAAMGLGKLFATRAVREGAATVVLWDANETALKQTAAELEAVGGVVAAEVVDVTSAERVTGAAARVRADVGAVHVLFNNAGIVRGNGYFWESAPRDFTQTMEVNAIGPIRFMVPALNQRAMATARAFPDNSAARQSQLRGIGPRRNCSPCRCRGSRFRLGGGLHSEVESRSRSISRSTYSLT